MPNQIHQRARIHYFGIARGYFSAEYLTGDPGLHCGLGPNRAGRNPRAASSITTTHEQAIGGDRRWAAGANILAKNCRIRRHTGIRDPKAPSATGFVSGRQVHKPTPLLLDGRFIKPGSFRVVPDQFAELKSLILAGNPISAVGAGSHHPASSNLSPSPRERSATPRQCKLGPATTDFDRCPGVPTSATPPRPP